MLIDMHCDTISELQYRGDEENLVHNTLCVNLERMRQAEIWIQYFACFVNVGKYERELQSGQGTTGEAWEMAWQEALHLIKRLWREESDRIQIIGSCSEAEEIGSQKIAAFPTVEEGGVLNGRVERLEELYQKGVRLLTLTWNYENCIGYPNSRSVKFMRQGLKPFGFEVVERMNELGMIIDVSHLSDGGFWDCIQKSKAPIVASHSNTRALCDHPRNLSDEMLRALAEKGGAAGLNFYPAFLKEKGRVTTADIARHAKYMIETAGEDVVAIGTDFDGFEIEIKKGYISHPGETELVWESCKKAGITERQLDKIRWQNAWRVMKDILYL